nr:hypothetical protein [Desulfobacterales bacterium]
MISYKSITQFVTIQVTERGEVSLGKVSRKRNICRDGPLHFPPFRITMKSRVADNKSRHRWSVSVNRLVALTMTPFDSCPKTDVLRCGVVTCDA